MEYIHDYESPLGKILISADAQGVTGLWFYGQKYFAAGLKEHMGYDCLPIFTEVDHWLDCYFAGDRPEQLPALHMKGTDFQIQVWKKLLQIPYGETTTYGALAREIATDNHLKSMSAQAVGGAVGHNKISIIIPCHRVLGSDRSLTGYAGGIDKKLSLLKLEGVSIHE